MAGINNGGGEYREYIWPVMLLFALGLILTFRNFYATVKAAQDPRDLREQLVPARRTGVDHRTNHHRLRASGTRTAWARPSSKATTCTKAWACGS
jgi:hypothetical protein